MFFLFQYCSSQDNPGYTAHCKCAENKKPALNGHAKSANGCAKNGGKNGGTGASHAEMGHLMNEHSTVQGRDNTTGTVSRSRIGLAH